MTFWDAHGALVWWAAGISGGSLLVGLIAVRSFILRLPPAYLATHGAPGGASGAGGNASPRSLLALAGRNALGAVLVAAGVAMLVLPGQGILTIIVGMALLDFPGKRRLERWVLTRGPVLRSVNRVRRRYGLAALEVRTSGR